MLDHCIEGQIDEAVAIVTKLFNFGYASEDIIQNIFKVAKTHKAMEYIKLEWMKQIGLANMRILEGCTSLLQDSVSNYLYGVSKYQNLKNTLKLNCLVGKLCN